MNHPLTLISCGILLVAYTAAMPQDLGDFEQGEDSNNRQNLNHKEAVNSRYYSGYNNGYNGGYYNGGYPSQSQDVYYNNGYSSGSQYGNSYNKAGRCPLYGRRRREAETGPEIAQARYYSNGNSYYSGYSSNYCNNDSDCSGNLKCCNSYGQRQCSYPHYSGGYGYGK